MAKLKLKVLTEDLLLQVFDEALALLADPGVRVHHKGALDLLENGGARINREMMVASLPEDLIRAALVTAPQEFHLYNLEGEPVVHYGGDLVHFDPGSAAVTILDSRTGKQRQPVTRDFINFVKLVETLPVLDAQSTAFIPRDVPPEMGDLYRLYLALNFMHKPIITGAFTRNGWQVMWEMLAAVRGGEEALAAHPLAVFDVCPSPPLLWSELTCQNLMDCAAKRIPAELISMPLAGVAAPVTLLGCIVQHTAENLSGLVIHQLANPGAPIVWGGAPAVVDMRHGTTPMGDPGTWLIDLAIIEMGKALSLPTHTYMGSSDSKALDMQAGAESMGGILLAALSGANMVSGVGMIDFLRCQSMEKLVMDAALIEYARRVAQGIETRETSLGLEQLRQNPHQADFLERSHTRKWFKMELLMPSNVIDRGSLEHWESTGAMQANQQAHAMIPKLLSTYQPNHLSDELRQELHRITLSTARHFGCDQLPELSETQEIQ